MSINHFGRDIKALRKKRKIGSRELSRLIGKAETYISQLERGLIKRPDFNTAFSIMLHLGFEEKNIEGFLDSFYGIISPEKIELEAEQVANMEETRAAEIEEMWIQRKQETETNTEYQQNQFNYDINSFESDWMMDLYAQLEIKNDEINRELSFNIEKNMKTFESVIENLHSLITSMRLSRENFNFFVGLFDKDLTILNEESKEKILKVVKEELKKHFLNI